MRECKSSFLASGKWLVASGYYYIECYGNIQKFNGLARGDESCRNGVFGNKRISKGRDLRFDESNSQGSGIRSEQYSGRERQNEQQGLCSFPLDSQWLIEGTRNSNADIGKDRLFEQRKMRENNKADWLSGSFVDSIKKIARKVTTSHFPLATSQACKFKLQRGFGLLEVIVAAVVLGFLIVGLNTLQKGNREGVLRVRARDAASFVAQHVLDSLGATGINSITVIDPSNKLVFKDSTYKYSFEGKPQINKNLDGIKVDVKYNVEVALLHTTGEASEATNFSIANKDADTINQYSKSLEATVTWDFKNSKQSIKMAKVVR
jgi:prepilin-type N-terminal cleavage/methylation domain-containing protein